MRHGGWILLTCSLAALVGVSAGCKRTPKNAREDLARLGVPYTDAEFIGRCARGPTSLIDTFLAAGADPNVVVTDQTISYTPLMAAAEAGRLDIAQQLLRAGARADLQAADGRTALDVASKNCRHPEVAKLLIERGARPNANSLFAAIWDMEQHRLDCGSATFAELVAAASDLNARDEKGGMTLLMLAAERGQAAAVHILLQARLRPDLDARGGLNKWTAVQFACRRAQADRNAANLPIVQELLRAGADPNIPDAYGVTALQSLGDPSRSPQLDPIREAITRPRL